MCTDLHVPSPPFPRYHLDLAPASQFLNPPEAVRKTAVELPMNFGGQCGEYLAGIDGADVDGCLDSDMSRRFELEVAPRRLGREIGIERALNIDRARIRWIQVIVATRYFVGLSVDTGS
jgi:hypothetical protein